MIAATGIKKGMAIELEGQLYTIIDFRHIKMGRGTTAPLSVIGTRNGSYAERAG